MRLVFKAIKWLALLLGLLLVIGFMLPARYEASRTIVINAPAQKIQSLVDAPVAWKQWSPWNARDPNMQITYSGPERGVGAKWSWISKTEGNGEMAFTSIEPSKRVEYSLRFDDMDRPSQGEMTFSPAGSGTEVKWRMYGEMGGNPIHKWFAFFMDRLIGPDFESGLKALKALAQKP